MVERLKQSSFWLNAWDALSRVMPWVQGLYYIVFGLWAQLSIFTFMQFTGPKTDIWLVKVVGLLLIVSGSVLIMSAFRRRTPLEVAALGAGNALVLAGADLVYVLTRAISPIYLVDAAIEAVFLLGWIRYGGRFEK
jgi:cytochrome b subunit of formate dehydrogenase